jgi:hypothetical protein
MDSEQIIKLLDAGYTKADIDKMEAKPNQQESGSHDDTAGTEGAGSSENKEENKEGKKEVTADEAIKALTETVNSLTETVKAMQAKNVAGATGGKTEAKTVDEVMQSFIENL